MKGNDRKFAGSFYLGTKLSDTGQGIVRRTRVPVAVVQENNGAFCAFGQNTVCDGRGGPVASPIFTGGVPEDDSFISGQTPEEQR
jgi:hypothetical protein